MDTRQDAGPPRGIPVPGGHRDRNDRHGCGPSHSGGLRRHFHSRSNPDLSVQPCGQRFADAAQREHGDIEFSALGVLVGTEQHRRDAAPAHTGHRLLSAASDAQAVGGQARARRHDGREKTYRIFVEELPPAEAPKGVRVLTKMGIPIFLRPAKQVATAQLADLRQQGGMLKFTLSNVGTVHVIPRSIKVRGLAGTTTAFEQDVAGWYLLAGGRRDFEATLPKNGCTQVTSVIVDVQFESGQLQQALQTPNGACPR
jgi:hypothetical protein